MKQNEEPQVVARLMVKQKNGSPPFELVIFAGAEDAPASILVGAHIQGAKNNGKLSGV